MRSQFKIGDYIRLLETGAVYKLVEYRDWSRGTGVGIYAGEGYWLGKPYPESAGIFEGKAVDLSGLQTDRWELCTDFRWWALSIAEKAEVVDAAG